LGGFGGFELRSLFLLLCLLWLLWLLELLGILRGFVGGGMEGGADGLAPRGSAERVDVFVLVRLHWLFGRKSYWYVGFLRNKPLAFPLCGCVV
jgi:hypothetical protein